MGEGLMQQAEEWFESEGWYSFPFQREAWASYLKGESGLVNAPTGSGKTYSLALPIILDSINNPVEKRALRAIWITPIRALAREIFLAVNRAAEGMDLQWETAVRTGDTSTAERKKIRQAPPDMLITTPESLHLMLAQKGYDSYFRHLEVIVCDEWHELIGSKRGVQTELAVSRLASVVPGLRIWGISATIGNIDQAMKVLLGKHKKARGRLVRADLRKEISVETVFPDHVDELPWAGHLGIKLIDKVIPIIRQSRSTLIFTNTRSFAEIWYQKLLEHAPDLSGLMAMHHGSISRELRDWVENALHEGQLKAVVCTSSLDLGVDFRPVETIIQIGSPKGVARFMQRAGRSGHQPGASSTIHFVPTHSLELIESAALRQGIKEGVLEDRMPYVRSFDVLVQYMVTLAVSDGFDPDLLYREITDTFSFESVSPEEWAWLLDFITTGGTSLKVYDEFHKVEKEGELYKVSNRRVAYRHRLSIGTIVSDTAIQVRYLNGQFIGTIEEYFISRLSPGDVFWFAGRNLELVRLKEMTAQVRNSKKKSARVPSWQGGRMPLSARMSAVLRDKIDELARITEYKDPELAFLQPLMDRQRMESLIPSSDEFLIEYFESSEGFHLLMYPFEGRLVHEGLAALLAFRIAKIKPITFSMAINDYGFELLSDQEIPYLEALETDVLSSGNLWQDIQASINSVEMARRKFRDIASIAGLVFRGYPGKPVKDRHLQSNSQLFFDVFNDYENHNLLLLQAYEEVMDFQLEEARMRKALERINRQRFVVKTPAKPTPFAFPIMVDRLSRDRLSSERMEDRIKRMQLQF